MTPEEQQIALAEWAGWKELRDGRYKKDGVVERFTPNYPKDLNAVHELEEQLKNNSYDWAKYGWELQEVCYFYPVGMIPNYNRDLRSLASVAHATAAQRCEAILKTLNLWKP